MISAASIRNKNSSSTISTTGLLDSTRPMRLTPCEHQQAVDFVLVPALPNSRTRTLGQGSHRRRRTLHAAKALTDKSSQASRIGGAKKGIAARRIGLTQSEQNRNIHSCPPAVREFC